jgi:hypothetical protein
LGGRARPLGLGFERRGFLTARLPLAKCGGFVSLDRSRLRLCRLLDGRLARRVLTLDADLFFRVLAREPLFSRGGGFLGCQFSSFSFQLPFTRNDLSFGVGLLSLDRKTRRVGFGIGFLSVQLALASQLVVAEHGAGDFFDLALDTIQEAALWSARIFHVFLSHARRSGADPGVPEVIVGNRPVDDVTKDSSARVAGADGFG